MDQQYSSKSSTKTDYYQSYARNSRAVGVLWAIFTICFAIIVVLIFLQTYWVGHTESSSKEGHFGLYQQCGIDKESGIDKCSGSLNEFSEIFSDANKAATVFVGLAVIFTFLSIICMLLLLFMKSRTAYLLCGSIQFLAFICLLVACLVYPVGWSSEAVREVCGPKADVYNLGTCAIRWVYILAIIGAVDALLLSLLALVLSFKHKQLSTEQHEDLSTNPNVMYGGGGPEQTLTMTRDGRPNGMLYSPRSGSESGSQFTGAGIPGAGSGGGGGNNDSPSPGSGPQQLLLQQQQLYGTLQQQQQHQQLLQQHYQMQMHMQQQQPPISARSMTPMITPPGGYGRNFQL